MQLKANFKKEILAFTRTKMLMIIVLVFVGLAIFDPLMYRGMAMLVEVMSDSFEEMNLGVEGMIALFTEDASTGVLGFMTDITLMGMIIFLLLINGFAGGEQKKRSIIIPRSSGLRSLGYILPKFIIYPIAAFVVSLLGVLVAGALSAVIFINNDLEVGRLFTAGALMGVSLAMYTCFHLALGTATGKAGMSAAVCIGASILVPTFFELLSTGFDGDLIAYNPFAFTNMALGALFGQAPPADEILITVAIAVGIMIAVYFLALFVQNARKIDNTGNEMIL
jgi:ABC-2 type transport system permease protein